MQTSIWIVQGKTGTEEDETSWLIAAYASKEAAEQHCELAAEAMRIILGDKPTFARSQAAQKVGTPYDHHTRIYDLPPTKTRKRGTYGVDYSVVEVPFPSHVDEFRELFTTQDG